MAVAQISDATAADLAYCGERLGHPVTAERGVKPVAHPLQRRAVVRRAEERHGLFVAAGYDIGECNKIL